MGAKKAAQDVLDPASREFYSQVLTILNDAGIPFLIGGAFALGHYTGIIRRTKDLDIFVHPQDVDRTLAAFAAQGYQTELTAPHWLAKAFYKDDFVDVIFSSGNGVARVDEEWFQHASAGKILGKTVQVCPVEEILWSKVFILARERCDAADVAHLLRACAAELDWPRLLRRFDAHWRVLLSQLILFGFIYPAERAQIPAQVMQELLDRLQAELTSEAPADPVCQGTLLSWDQYLIDMEEWGYQDGRLRPRGNLTAEEIAFQTERTRQENAARHG
jgi:hypothetical protein